MVKIPQNLKGKDLTNFLLQNKEELMQQKKSMPVKFSDSLAVDISLYHVKADGQIVKATPGDPVDADTVRVKVVANTANWCDSHMDVLLPDCWKKTMKDRKGMIPFLRDHEYKIAAEIGDVVNIYSQEMSLIELGINKAGTTQCLIFEADIRKSYDEKAFNKYKAGKVKQHSIGLRYIKLELAINDESSEKEYDFWTKHIQHVINREYVEEKGYFWVVPEIMLLENSAVLFGSNILTPTLSVKSESTEDEPDESTQAQPPTSNKQQIQTLKTFKLFN